MKTILLKIYRLIYRFNTLDKYLIILLSLLVGAITFWTLNRGLVFSDEAYYLMHLGPIRKPQYSSWYLYANFLFNGDLLHLRIITYASLLLSGILVSIGLSKYYGYSSFVLCFLSVFFLYGFYAPVQLIPNYITFSIFIFYSSFGLVLIAKSTSNNWLISFLISIAGFLSGSLLFIFITNTPYIFLLGLLICIIFAKNLRKFVLLSYFLGLFLSFVFFFSILQNPYDFMDSFKEASLYVALEGSHGVFRIMQWTFGLLKFFVEKLLIPSLALSWILMPAVKFRSFYFRIFALLVIFLNLFYNQSTSGEILKELNISSLSAVYIVLITLLIKYGHRFNFTEFVICIFCAIIPILGSLGTNVSFQIRGTNYLVPLGLVTYILLNKLGVSYLKVFFSAILLLVFMNYLSYLNKPGWAQYSFISQSEYSDFSRIRNIKLDPTSINELDALKKSVPPKSNVIIDSPNLYGAAYILDWNLPYLYFRFNEEIFPKLNIKLPKEFFFITTSQNERLPSWVQENKIINEFKLRGVRYRVYKVIL
ncbi:MAG: hypothetical protein N2044_10020 [Cyclobacteriaceae bacterium]|nr:hypothetical protein [Cyclobacteriaceae bacterium]